MATELYRTGLEEDLRPISALLWQKRIPHRIVEEDGAQVLILHDEGHREDAQSLIQSWRAGELQISLKPAPPRRARGGLLPTLMSVPVTGTLIVLSVFGFLCVYLGLVDLIRVLTFEPFDLVRGRPVFSEATGQPWRLVTPVFLHFGWMHIVFNSLWCWELGKRIEQRLGSVNLAGLFLVTAIVSNVAQHLWTGPVLFGGLSGVVYALLGFAWVAGQLNPIWRDLAPATPIMLFMVGWLLICVFGFIDVLGFSVANAAHVAGLLSGAAIGLVFGLAYRRSPS